MRIKVYVPESNRTYEYVLDWHGFYMEREYFSTSDRKRSLVKFNVPQPFAVLKHIFLKRGVYRNRVITLQLW